MSKPKENRVKKQQKVKSVLLMLAILTLLFIDGLLVFKPTIINPIKSMEHIKITGLVVDEAREELPSPKEIPFIKEILVGLMIMLLIIISKGIWVKRLNNKEHIGKK